MNNFISYTMCIGFILGGNMKFIRLMVVGLILSLVLVGCTSAEEPVEEVMKLEGTISIDGSSTVFPITELVAEEFNAVNPDVKLTVGFSGTGGGFTKFAAKEIEISGASRPIKTAEADAATAAGIEFVELMVAYDGLSVVVAKDNTWVDYLTMEELAMIWGAEATATKWSDVRAGFPDTDIRLYSPGHDSGTFDYFTEAVNGKGGVIRQDSEVVKIFFSEDDNALVTGVAGDLGAIGYFGFAYFEENADKLKLVPIQKDATAVAPSFDTISDSSYPLSRPLFIYVNKAELDRPEILAFVTFYLENAAELAAEVGYVSLPEEMYTEALAKLQ
jgi:phosphate transport system substrate-binding protein